MKMYVVMFHVEVYDNWLERYRNSRDIPVMTFDTKENAENYIKNLQKDDITAHINKHEISKFLCFNYDGHIDHDLKVNCIIERSWRHGYHVKDVAINWVYYTCLEPYERPMSDEITVHYEIYECPHKGL